jgi:hypothetical protein
VKTTDLRSLAGTAVFFVIAAGVLACGSPSQQESKFPTREPGCEILIFPESPSYQTENIGPVQASCDETISDEECLRTLKDQACKLGADTIWGVSDTPTIEAGKKKFFGRAAHQK